MSNLTNVIEGVVKDLKAGYNIDFVSGTASEMNLESNSIDMLIFLQKPYPTTPVMLSGGRTYQETITMIFAKVDIFENSYENKEPIIDVCIDIYEQFIQRLKLVELLRVTSESFTQIYNDKDINLTGLVATISIERKILTKCLL